MIKQVSVTFDFDLETESVSNVKCSVDGIESKKKTTKKLKDIVSDLSSEPIITLEPNKLVFNNVAISKMDIHYEDRIVIKWEKLDGKLVPVIGKDLAFDEEGAGNKVTKSNTVTYKGKANTVLAEYGSEFTIFESKKGIWRLIPNNVKNPSAEVSDIPEQDLSEIITIAENTEADLITDSKEDTDIKELKFIL